MSASREKKQRMASAANGPTEKQRREAAEAGKARTRTILYTVTGVVIAVLVIALLVWHSGILEKGKPVATVNGRDYTVAEMGYYYYPTANMYNQYGIAMDEATLRQNALDSLHSTAALAAAAEADGFTLSEEGAASVDETISNLRTYAAQSGLSFTAYIRNAYGPYMTEGILRDCLTMDTLAQEYYNDHRNALTYEESEVQAYYEEHAGELDTFTYSAVFIDGSAESTTDDTGSTVEPTEEETTAAMADAQAIADQMIQDLENGGDFDSLAAEAAGSAETTDGAAGDAATTGETEETEPVSYETTELGSSLANSLNADCAEWLTDAARESGDLTTIEVADSGYWVLRFQDRYLDEESWGDVNVRHILIQAEVAEGADAPTDEALQAAQDQAQAILDQFNAGEQTAEAFAALAEEYSDDLGSNTNGGLYEHVTPSTSFFTDFLDWCFAGGRQVGDTGLVENTQSGQQGWHIMYLDAQNELLWHYTVTNTLRGEDMSAWTEEIETAYPIASDEKTLALLG
ncbi:peptidylprolyl isomerase [uncultured Intestinimonas sp.]|uniref:peptidylprolyl isomerase n=1 Tax=uncultured Intestinimonas sp. TaxID=1689265 RepID=UPI0025EF912E|nr:peptidylprolyl isomerase [uncultured Intestinimonas sp.]